MTKLLGTPIAEEIKKRLKNEIANLDFTPKLAIINISTDPAVETYMRLKRQFAEEIGADIEILSPEPTALDQTIQRLNADSAVHGILIQLPLPNFVDTITTVESVAPNKDVDGLKKDSPFVTADPRGIVELLAAYDISLVNKAVSLVGTGILIGRPLLAELRRLGANVTTFDLDHPIQPEILRASDVIIGATGQDGLITADCVGAGSLIIDATGVDLEKAVEKRTDITLVPSKGGVGPMTIAALYENLLEAAQKQA